MANTKSNKSNQNSEDTNVADNENTEPTRTDSIDVGPEQGGNLLAAWRGIFHLMGGRAEFALVDGGFAARNFSVVEPYNPSTILRDVSGRDRRVDAQDALPILSGGTPAPFKEALEMTKWMQQYFRKPGEDGKSPEYVKDAIANYKKAQGFPGRRGRPKKIIRLDSLSKLGPDAFSQVKNVDELESLRAVLDQVIASRAETTEATA